MIPETGSYAECKRAVLEMVSPDPCAICGVGFIVMEEERTDFPICPECNKSAFKVQINAGDGIRAVYCVDISKLPDKALHQTVGTWKARLRTHGMEIDVAGNRDED